MTIAELEPETTGNPDLHASNLLKALVYHGPGKPAWEDKLRPARAFQVSGNEISCPSFHVPSLRRHRPFSRTSGPFWDEAEPISRDGQFCSDLRNSRDYKIDGPERRAEEPKSALYEAKEKYENQHERQAQGQFP